MFGPRSARCLSGIGQGHARSSRSLQHNVSEGKGSSPMAGPAAPGPAGAAAALACTWVFLGMVAPLGDPAGPHPRGPRVRPPYWHCIWCGCTSRRHRLRGGTSRMWSGGGLWVVWWWSGGGLGVCLGVVWGWSGGGLGVVWGGLGVAWGWSEGCLGGISGAKTAKMVRVIRV